MSINVRDWIKTAVTAGVLSIIVVQFIAPTRVFGHSMEPTLNDNDFIVVNRCAYVNGITPSKGDIVVFQSHLKDQNGNDKRLIKRVIAVPGDTVMIKEGKVYINGEELQEEYINDGITSGDVDLVTVPAGSVYCMGDNRLHSTDSRHMEVGFVRYEQILGKAVVRVFPFSDMKIIAE